jgi:hypothetical protein
VITHLRWGQSRTDNLDGTKPARAQVDEVELERRPTPRHVKRSTQIDLIHCTEVEAASQNTLFVRGVRVPEAQYKESFRRIHGNLTRALRALVCCSRDDEGASSSSHASDHVYTAGPSTSAASHTASSGTAASSNCKSFIIIISINFDLHD